MKNVQVFAFADEASPMIDEQIKAMQRNGLQGLEIRSVDGENVSGISIAKAKEVYKKINLHQGFPACYGNAARLVEGFVSLILGINLFGRHLGAADHCPGIRIVTVKAAHRTSLHKYNKPCARSVYCAEGFK